MQNDNSKFKNNFYKRLIKFSLRIIRLCAKLRKIRNLWVIADQLLASGTSIGANVFEAKSSSSKKDYIKFFEIALKSANESIYWLLIIESSTLELKEEVKAINDEAKEIARILASGILTMKGKR